MRHERRPAAPLPSGRLADATKEIPRGVWLGSGKPIHVVMKRPVTPGDHPDERFRWRLAALCTHGYRVMIYFYEEADCDTYIRIVKADACAWTGCRTPDESQRVAPVRRSRRPDPHRRTG